MTLLCLQGSNQSKNILKNLTMRLIKEELECLQETKGVRGTLPNVIHTVISYEACRGSEEVLKTF